MTARLVSPGVVRVTYSTAKRTPAPGVVRAAVAAAPLLGVPAAALSPRIVAQSATARTMTWEVAR